MEAFASDCLHQYNTSSKNFLSQTTMVDENFCNKMNPNPSHNQRNGTTQHLQRRLNVKVGHKQEGTWLSVILDKMGCVSLSFMPREEM